MKRKYLLLTIIILLLTSCKTKTYTVTFVDNNQELSNIVVKKGDNLKDIDIPKKEGYIFLNWLKDGLDYDMSSPINEDIILTATWVEEPNSPNTHTVTFDFGTFKKTQTVFNGELASEPKETPVKEKYTFLGWYYNNKLFDFNTPINEDIAIIAKFEKNRIIINYDLNGGSGTIEVEIDKGTIPTVPKTPTRFGYTFTNWTINGKKYSFDSPLYEDTTIKANYEANVYVRVSFNTDGGNTIQSQMLILGESLKSLPTPQKEGYTFKYWSYKDEEFNINTKITTDITLVAIYEPNEETDIT